MRQINEARRQRARSLSECRKENASARRKLLAELDRLDAQTRTMFLELNMLHNLDAATADLPDEILGMIFDVDDDITLHQRCNPQLGPLASHVCHRWRRIALSTPRLWTRVRYMAGKRSTVEQFSLHLSRSNLAPVDIYLELVQLSLDPYQDQDQDS